MTFKSFILFLVFNLAAPVTGAQNREFVAGAIYLGETPQKEISLFDLVHSLRPGTVLVIGEIHGQASVQAGQMQILKALRLAGRRVSVGLEFLNSTNQAHIDSYNQGLMGDDQFKTLIGWSGFNFSYYKEQILFPHFKNGERALGLNVPSTVTQQIAQGGYASLTETQKALLPANFTLGNPTYKQRFMVAAGHHLSPLKADFYFEAQSAWDEAMASTAVEYLKTYGTDIFVIIVGEFHSQYGGGLPDRLRARLAKDSLPFPVKTLSLLPAVDLTPAELKSETIPSRVYGPRADFIWLVN